MDTKSKQKMIGIGAIGLVAYYLYSSGAAASSDSSGSFGTTGGGGVISEEGVEATTEDGTAYNITFPETDYSSLTSLLTSAGATDTTKKESAIAKSTASTPVSYTPGTSTSVSSNPDSSNVKTSSSGGISSLLGTSYNASGDAVSYGGGGAGAVKGESIGSTVLGYLTADPVLDKSSLSSGTSTDSPYSLEGVDVASIVGNGVVTSNPTKKELSSYTGETVDLNTVEHEIRDPSGRATITQMVSPAGEVISSKKASNSSSSGSGSSPSSSSTPTKKKSYSLSDVKSGKNR